MRRGAGRQAGRGRHVVVVVVRGVGARDGDGHGRGMLVDLLVTGLLVLVGIAAAAALDGARPAIVARVDVDLAHCAGGQKKSMNVCVCVLVAPCWALVFGGVAMWLRWHEVCKLNVDG